MCLDPVKDTPPVKCSTCKAVSHELCTIKMWKASIETRGGQLDGELKCGCCRSPLFPCAKRVYFAGKSDFESESSLLNDIFSHNLHMYDYQFRLLCSERDALRKSRSLLRPSAESYRRRCEAVEHQEYVCDILAGRLGLDDEDDIEFLRGQMQ